MDNTIKRNAVLVTILVYLVFACNYVVLCKRETSVVNLFNCFHSPNTLQKKSAPEVVKKSASPGKSTFPKFLSRPRVISTKTVNHNLSQSISVLLFVFAFFAITNCLSHYIKNKFFLLPSSRLIYYCSWRI